MCGLPHTDTARENPRKTACFIGTSRAFPFPVYHLVRRLLSGRFFQRIHALQF